jgi:uncharacterized protein (TIGR03067 family)
MKSGFLVTSLAILLPGAWAIGGGPPQDLRRMAGTWSSLIVETGGKESTAEERGKLKMKLIIAGEGYRLFFGDEQVATGIVKLDATTKPASIDVIPGDGPHKGKVQQGIYAFQGDDMWTVFAAPGEPRPTGFKTRPGSMESMIFYRRAK